MNFIERQGMVRFEAFPVQCMMHEVLLKKYTGCLNFSLQKKLWVEIKKCS